MKGHILYFDEKESLFCSFCDSYKTIIVSFEYETEEEFNLLEKYFGDSGGAEFHICRDCYNSMKIGENVLKKQVKLPDEFLDIKMENNFEEIADFVQREKDK